MFLNLGAKLAGKFDWPIDWTKDLLCVVKLGRDQSEVILKKKLRLNRMLI